MMKDAERYAEEDRKRRDTAEKLNAADATCYEAEKTLADFGERLSSEMRSGMEAALRDVHDALSKHDVALATARAEALKQVVQEAGATLYTHATQAGPQPHVSPGNGGAQPPGAGPHGRVVDAEYQEARPR